MQYFLSLSLLINFLEGDYLQYGQIPCNSPSISIQFPFILFSNQWVPNTPKKNKKQKSFQLKSVLENRNWFFVNLFTLYQDEMKQLAKSVRMAIYVTNTANIVLFAAKIFASIESKSLAVIASILAPLFDLLWGFILWFTSHAMQNPNQHRYPIGKKRMQPVVSHSTQQLWGCIWKHFNV